MKKSNLLKLTILLLISSTLSGCIWVEPIGHRNGDSGDNGRQRGEKQGRH